MAFNVPILFLIFNRPDTTTKVIKQIRSIKPSKLFIAADGPRKDREQEKERCEEVRSLVLNAIDWDCEVKTLFRDHNLGCGLAVSEAITWFFEHVNEGIILEDDILTDQPFFNFCELMLEKYRGDTRIMHINGANSVYPFIKITGSHYFSKMPSAWGWATWKRAWTKYKFDVNELDEKKIISEIDHWAGDSRISNYLLKIFFKAKAREIDTWDYQWLFTIFESGGLVVTPAINLALNIGFENNPTHTGSAVALHYSHMRLQELTSFEGDVEIKPNLKADRYGMKRYLGLTDNIFFRVLKFARRQLQNKN